MKKLGLVLSMSSLMVMLAVVPALGVGPLGHKIQADIPFDFMVGDKTFPAGTYTFADPNITPGVLLIRSLDRHESMLVATRDVENLTRPDETKLVFSRYGDLYFLAQVWTVGDVSGLELLKSSTESEVAENFSRQVLALAG